MATNTISQRIQLEGAEDIIRQLKAIGEAGSRAFAQVAQAISPATAQLTSVTVAMERVAASMRKVQIAAVAFGASFNKFNQSFGAFNKSVGSVVTRLGVLGIGLTAAGVGIGRFITNGIKAGDALDEEAQALGLTTDQLQQYTFAAEEAGVSGEKFGAAIRIASKNISAAFDEQQKDLLEFGLGIEKAFDSMGGRIVRVGNLAAIPFDKIREGAKKLQAQFAQTGKNIPLFELEQGLLKLATGTDKMREKFEELTGQTLPASADGFDGLRKSIQGPGDAIRKLGVQFKTTEQGTVDFENVLLQLADKFSQMPDGARKTALALQIFGKSGAALLPFLNQGSKDIKGFLETSKELGIFLSKDQIAASAAAAKSFDILGQAAKNVQNSIGAAFAPVAKTVASSFTQFISANQKALNDFATELNTRITPYVQAFIQLFQSGDDEILSEKFGEVADTVREIKTAFTEAGKAIKATFTFLLGALDKVAKAINAVFGTKLTGAALAVILVVGKVTGAFGVLTAAVKLVASTVGLVASGMTLLIAKGGLVINAFRLLGTQLVFFLGLPGAIIVGLLLLIAHINDVTKAFNKMFGTSATEAEVFATAVGLVTAAFIALRAATDAALAALVRLFAHPAFRAIALLGNLMGALAPKIEKVEEAAPKASGALIGTGNAARIAAGGVRDLNNAQGSTVSGVIDVNEALKKQKQGLDDWGGRIKTAPKETKQLADAQTAAVPQLKNFQDVLNFQSKSFADLGTSIQNFLKADFGQWVKDQLKFLEPFVTFIENLKTKLDEALAKLNTFINRKAEVETGGGAGTFTGVPFAPQGPPGGSFGKDIVDKFDRGEIPAPTGGFEDRRGQNAEVTAQLEDAKAKITAVLEEVKTATTEAINEVALKLPEFLEVAVALINEVVAKVGDGFKIVVEDFGKLGTDAGNAFKNGIQGALDGISGIFDGFRALVVSVFEGIQTAVDAAAARVQAAIDAIIAALEAAVAKARALAAEAAAAAASASGGGGGGGGGGEGTVEAASGGHIRGAGTSTSDSIRAWLSDGEFVEPTRVVRRYGADLFEAFRRGRVSLKAARSLIEGRRFNVGGLVQSMSPVMVPRFRHGFADGGSVSKQSAFTLQLPNGQQHQLNGSASAVDSIHNWAKFSVLASAGKKAR